VVSPHEPGDADFLLVHSDWLSGHAEGAGALEETAGPWRERGIPTVYWFTGDRGSLTDGDAVAAGFDIACAADPEAAPLLAARPGSRTMILPLACPVFPDDVALVGERPIAVALIGAGADGHPALDGIIEAAEARGLQRFASEQAGDVLAQAKVTIVPPPPGASKLLAPELAYRCIGLGSLVLTPPHRGYQFGALREAVTPAKNSDQAHAALERLLDSPKEQSELQQFGRAVVANGQTYAHRVATIASALGRRVLPVRA
jgi:hypothetical protein